MPARTANGRIGFGDEIWRLARARDARGLAHAAELLLDAGGSETDYDVQRARAFELAIRGHGSVQALAVLEEGWTDEWPFPAAYATDMARVRYLAGEYGDALGALRLAGHGVERHLDDSIAELTIACVERAPETRWRALRVAFAGGTLQQRLALAAAVLRARR